LISSPAAVLVVREDAAEYLPELASLIAAGVRVNYTNSAAAALEHHQSENILLAQPDMAASIIDQLPSVQWIQSTWAGVTPLLRTHRQDHLLTGVKPADPAAAIALRVGCASARQLCRTDPGQ
jgi:hypothetical protein